MDLLDMTEDQIKTAIRQLIARRKAVRKGSAEDRMIDRQLIGIRDSSELADLIMQDFQMSALVSVP
jgi:CO dehydrogenase/acetyl-CoA synthase gamma subunit (corrinoid Fe-S protein)